MTHKSGEIFSVKGKPNTAGPLKLGKKEGARTTKIMGAPEVSDSPPETLDSRSRVEQPPVEMAAHMDTVTVREHVRSRPTKKDEPEVRVRTMGKDERENWNRVRRAEEE